MSIASGLVKRCPQVVLRRTYRLEFEISQCSLAGSEVNHLNCIELIEELK